MCRRPWRKPKFDADVQHSMLADQSSIETIIFKHDRCGADRPSAAGSGETDGYGSGFAAVQCLLGSASLCVTADVNSLGLHLAMWHCSRLSRMIKQAQATR